jgi:hypothetical protein
MITLDDSTKQEFNLRANDVVVIEATNSKVRTFLYELAEGTSNYRSLHSLTEQVEHQYHGRFIVELIQNAHDALWSTSSRSDQSARIEIALKEEGRFGALYVANDGRPFSASNFNSLSQLGQSDKNPEESIGNKGIGFRSVLEITDAPEIYSRSTPDCPHFNGFCFTFSPEVIHRLTVPILSLLKGNDQAVSPFGNVPLVDWDAKLLTKFRASVISIAEKEKMLAEDWLTRELTYLSPYLLPFPTHSLESGAFISEYERRGFATVLRFPLKNEATLALVRAKLNELNDNALLFLEKISSLVLDSGDQQRELNRYQETRSNSQLNCQEVSISEGNNAHLRRYWVWKREIALAAASEVVQTAVQQLPGKWPQLQKVAVSIGVMLGEEPKTGALSIFLPTFLETGCATHINAPFFGDMSRTHIDFGTDDEQSSSNDAIYNRFLLSEAARLAVFAVQNELSGQGLEEAQAVIDLLAPCGAEQSAKRWQKLIAYIANDSGIDIKTAAWFLSDHGWEMLSETSLLPETDCPSILTPQALRKHAVFACYVEALDSRRELIEILSEAHDIGAYPAVDDLASTVESIALDLHKDPEADWNGFWSDVNDLYDGNCSALVGKRILLGNDGQLHVGGTDDCTVFFIPRQGFSDDEEIENDGDVKEIPPTLRPFVAFLSESIQVYEEKNGRLQQTQIRKLLLDSKLVSRFRRDDILNDVLIARTPTLPVPLRSPDASLCRDILLWALRLMAHLDEHGKGGRSLQLLKRLAAPCKGGWYPLAETAFGPGWSGTNGDLTQNYLARLNTPETREAHQRLLLMPSDAWWGVSGSVHTNLLRLVGVFDGLRLISIDPKLWDSRFHAESYFFQLPQTPPPHWSESSWSEYRLVARNDAQPKYNKGNYEVQKLYALPGLDIYQEFDEDTRMALMEVILSSARQWEHDWDSLLINRIAGNWDSIHLLSPLAHSLSKLPWLGLVDGDAIEWCKPADRWHVPALELSRGRKWMFAHLRPLPGELANRLDMDERLASVMRRLGTPLFDPETKSASTQLLDTLTNAVIRDEVLNWDVFLGQVRSAWRGFEPIGIGSSPFPKRLLVQRGGSRLTVESPSEENPVYLPDSTKSFLVALKHFKLPVIAIEAEDSKRLANRFVTAFPKGVLRASTLKPVPLVGGEPWDGAPQDKFRDEAELEWTIPALLTVAAFYGPQAQGTTSKSFKNLLEIFRNARLSIVEKIETGLFRGETPVAPPLSVSALWLNGSQTLILSSQWKSKMASLSEALSNLLDRDDLDVPIKLMLEITGPEPEYEDIIRALEQLKVAEECFREVREYWRGDLSQVIERLIPFLTILKPDANIGQLVELDTDDAVIEFLNRLDDDKLDGESLVSMARDSTDMFDVGSRAFLCFGEDVQMCKWNAALVLHNQPPLVNIDALDTFKVHTAASAPVLKSLLAAIVARQPEVGTFRSLSEQLDDLVCPEEFGTDYWFVSFNQALSVSIPLFVKWQATPDEIAAVQTSSSTKELIELLAATGINVEFDPIQTARDNQEQLRHALTRLQQIGLAWALGSGYSNPADWESRVEGYLNYLSADFELTAFTHVWNEQKIWELLTRLPVDEMSSAFWSLVRVSSNLDDLIVRLGLSSEALSVANSKLNDLREETRRRKKVVQVCGNEFDAAEDNLSALWTHICSGLSTAALSALPSVDLKKLASLENVSSTGPKNRRKDSEPTNKPKQKYQSKSIENLIGLSGEIHAFRMLQNNYGSSAVSASSWVSGNSALVFPDNKTDDGKGCDFVVVLQDRTYYIEVKSSEGDSESFTLGSSEIRLAMELTKKTRQKRKEIFLMLRVSNALTTTPSFQLLPNPYDQKYQSFFVIEEADARVRYRSKN